MTPPPNDLAAAAYHLGIVTGRREICEGAVKKLKVQLANWRALVAKRPGFLALLLTGMAEPLVVELERLVAMSEAELVGLNTEQQRLQAAYQQQLEAANPMQTVVVPPLRPRPLAKARPRAGR